LKITSNAIVLLLLVSQVSLADDFYVRASGCDCNDGRSAATAFATISQAARSVRNPGDRIIVGPGLYREGDIAPNRNGIGTFPILFLADSTGALTGDVAGAVEVHPAPEQGTGFLLLGRSNIVIDGFVVVGASDAAVQVRTGAEVSRNVVIRNLLVLDSAKRGVDVTAAGEVVIEQTSVNGCGSTGITIATANTDGVAATIVENEVAGCAVHGIFVDGARGGTIEGNIIDDNERTGIQLRNSSEITIARNTIRGNQQGIDVTALVNPSMAGNRNIDIVSNRVEDSVLAGIKTVGQGEVWVSENVVLRSGSSGISLEGPIDLFSRLAATVSNNHVAMSGAHGIFVQNALGGSVIQNNVSSSNATTGLTVRNCPAPVIVNNLVHDNGANGIGLGTAGLAAAGAVIVNNTLARNAGWGIVVGSAGGPSPDALVLNNIFWENRDGGLTVGRESTCGYVAGFNINPNGYGTQTPRNAYDLNVDPLFLNPDDGSFRLQQVAAGQGQNSPGVDAGSSTIEELGITGSTASNGEPDTGRVDIGFHYDAESSQIIRATRPFMPIYVRTVGRDNTTGKNPARAFKSISNAVRTAQAGVTVVVGPGRYLEGNVSPPRNAGRAAFVAEPTGSSTGDSPGVVVVDADGNGTGFTVLDSCTAVIDGFLVLGARDAGIQVRQGSDGTSVQNNVVFSNRRGIEVIDADDVRVRNNLVYANQTGGIQIGGAVGSRNATIRSNTIYGNGANGILIGVGGGESTGARVEYNIIDLNGKNGIQIVSNTALGKSLPALTAQYNINTDGYAGMRRPDTDLDLEPLFIDPPGLDGLLACNGAGDDDFRLNQLAAGQQRQSPAVDFAPASVVEVALEGRSTRTDEVADIDPLDLGYHYALPPLGPIPARPKVDCDGDGMVSVSDLILGVNVALGTARVDECPSFDRNADGVVTVDEIVKAIDQALGGGEVCV
jgi:parallel beta-helix repeat protein